MKKTIALLLAVLMMITIIPLSLISCVDNNTQDDDPNVEAPQTLDSMPLNAILSQIVSLSGQEFPPSFETQELTPEITGVVLGYEGFSGDFEEALFFEPKISSTPFLLVLFRLHEGADVEAFAADVKQGSDPNKWLCVSADQVETAISGRTVFFAMIGSELMDMKLLTDAFAAIDPTTYNPDDYEDEGAMDSVTMSDILHSAAENCEFISMVDYINLDENAPFGFSAVDVNTLSDYIINQSAADSTSKYLFGLFRLTDDTDTNSFIATLQQNLDLTSFGDDCYVVTLTKEQVVAFIVAKSADEGDQLASFMLENYEMSVYFPQ